MELDPMTDFVWLVTSKKKKGEYCLKVLATVAGNEQFSFRRLGIFCSELLGSPWTQSFCLKSLIMKYIHALYSVLKLRVCFMTVFYVVFVSVYSIVLLFCSSCWGFISASNIVLTFKSALYPNSTGQVKCFCTNLFPKFSWGHNDTCDPFWIKLISIKKKRLGAVWRL